MPRYKKKIEETSHSQNPILSLLDQLVLRGAYQLIHEALEAEIEERLGREKYERTDKSGPTKEYRNGYSKERNLTLSCGSIKIKAPRLRETFESQIL